MPRIAFLFALGLALTQPGWATAQQQGVFVPPPDIGIGAAPSSEGLRGVRARVQNQLPIWGFRSVDVRTLSTRQVARIHSTIHSDMSDGDIRQRIAQILNSRRGILQQTLDNF